MFELPPRSPKLNGFVDRANRTFRDEFWQLYDGDPELRAEVRRWEHAYNHERPHQVLGYLTPAADLASLAEDHLWRTSRTSEPS